MRYFDTLNLAKKYGINHINLTIASEIEYKFGDINNELFEELCQLIKDAYLKIEYINIELMVERLYQLIVIEKKKIENISKYELYNERSEAD